MDESDKDDWDPSGVAHTLQEPVAAGQVTAGQVATQDPPIFASNHLDAVSVSNIPGHPEGEISPGADVRILTQYRVVMQGETLCHYADGSQLVRWRGHIENPSAPDSFPDFMRVIYFEGRVFLDTPLFVNNRVEESFQFSHRTSSISDFGLFLPTSLEAFQSAQPWNVAIPWVAEETPSEGFRNITNPVSNSITWTEPAEDIPECEHDSLGGDSTQFHRLQRQSDSSPLPLPSGD